MAKKGEEASLVHLVFVSLRPIEIFMLPPFETYGHGYLARENNKVTLSEMPMNVDVSWQKPRSGRKGANETQMTEFPVKRFLSLALSLSPLTFYGANAANHLSLSMDYGWLVKTWRAHIPSVVDFGQEI